MNERKLNEIYLILKIVIFGVIIPI